jgi:hypothetical protein
MLKDNALTTVDAVIGAIKMNPHVNATITWNDTDVIEQIERLINMYSADVESFTRRSFGVQTYIEYQSGTNQPYLVLNNSPIRSLESVELIGSNGEIFSAIDVEKMWNELSYRDKSAGLLYFEPNFVSRFSYYGLRPETFVSLRSIRVVYTAGYILPKDATDNVYSDLPSEIEGVVIEICKDKFIKDVDQKRAEGLIQLTEGNVQRNWGVPTKVLLNSDHKSILKRYKKKVL